MSTPSSTEPTPRPWTSIGPGEYGDRSVIARYPPQVHIVMTDDHASAAADVHLIVEAVNNYDRLKAIEAAAREAIDALAFWGSDGRNRVGFPVDRDGDSTPEQEAPFINLRNALETE